MLLENKNAIIYGASASLGGAIAKAFAKQGARVFLSNHKLETVQQLANEINAAGGKAEAGQLDAMNAKAIEEYLEAIILKAGRIDISLNVVGLQAVQDSPLVNMRLDDFIRPVLIAMQTHFLTSTAAGRLMSQQGSGVILSLTATPGGIAYPMVGGFGPACCAIESFSKNLAAELGPYGVRVVNIRSAGSPDSRPFAEAIATKPEIMEGVLKEMKNDTMLKELPAMEDIANAAVFLSSAMAGKITGTTLDITAGTVDALSYKTVAMPVK
jgi:NAD(P)-dependent dehydrogenase (short-subunit alcohol dehydrogenase family)